jgi:hypothetical protein
VGKRPAGRNSGIETPIHHRTPRHFHVSSLVYSHDLTVICTYVYSCRCTRCYASLRCKIATHPGYIFSVGESCPRYTLIPVSTAGSFCSGSLYYTHLDHDNGWTWIGEFPAARYMSIAAKFLRHGPTPHNATHACLLGLSSEPSVPSARLKAPRSPSPGPRRPTPIVPHCC